MRAWKIAAFHLKDDGSLRTTRAGRSWSSGASSGCRVPSTRRRVFEGIFARNGWTDGWRDGVYDYLHDHSRIQEVMGLRAARAKVRFGKHGRTFKLSAGDVVILPAGTGRKCIAASRRFLAVGPIHPSAPMMSAFRPKPGTPAIQYAYAIRILFSAPRGRASDGRQREREREREREKNGASSIRRISFDQKPKRRCS